MDKLDTKAEYGHVNSPQTAQNPEPLQSERRLAFVVVTKGKTREQMKADARALWTLEFGRRRREGQR